MRKVLESCPTCGGELTISGLQCHACHTRIESQYSTCPFCRLQQQSLDFIEIFVKSRGNIKEMERELGISYPTVRNRLNAVISELGYEVGAQPSSQDERGEERGEILKQLNDGKISAADAAELIRQLRRK
ncbi:MAG: DUF2089 domain-containing protein [Candidatus Latescibacteria bacterium]|nr:DUF2089 domain-containing protein [Candidatus Latescibacterota bacterium]